MGNEIPSSAQIRSALALLNLDNSWLSTAAGVSVDTVVNVKSGQSSMHKRVRDGIRRAFEARGVEFTDHEGVRLRPKGIETFEGADRFDDFYEALYDHLRQYGGDVCLSVTDERLLSRYRKDPDLHRRRMKELYGEGAGSFRILAKHSNFSSSYATYRLLPRESHQPTSFYAFGDCLALISFEPEPQVWMIRSSSMAEAYRQFFDVAWEHAQEPK